MNAKEAYENLINSFINEENVNTFEGRLKVFAEQICKEQREKCVLNIDQEAIYCGEEAIINRIMNAPMPEL